MRAHIYKCTNTNNFKVRLIFESIWFQIKLKRTNKISVWNQIDFPFEFKLDFHFVKICLIQFFKNRIIWLLFTEALHFLWIFILSDFTSDSSVNLFSISNLKIKTSRLSSKQTMNSFDNIPPETGPNSYNTNFCFKVI